MLLAASITGVGDAKEVDSGGRETSEDWDPYLACTPRNQTRVDLMVAR